MLFVFCLTHLTCFSFFLQFSPLIQDTILKGTFNATLNNPIAPQLDMSQHMGTNTKHAFLLGVWARTTKYYEPMEKAVTKQWSEVYIEMRDNLFTFWNGRNYVIMLVWLLWFLIFNFYIYKKHPSTYQTLFLQGFVKYTCVAN